MKRVTFNNNRESGYLLVEQVYLDVVLMRLTSCGYFIVEIA